MYSYIYNHIYIYIILYYIILYYITIYYTILYYIILYYKINISRDVYAHHLFSLFLKPEIVWFCPGRKGCGVGSGGGSELGLVLLEVGTHLGS